MGHYDSCYEADDRRADERSVNYVDMRFPKLTFDEKLAMKRAMDEFCRMFQKNRLTGTREDHREFEKIYEAFRPLT